MARRPRQSSFEWPPYVGIPPVSTGNTGNSAGRISTKDTARRRPVCRRRAPSRHGGASRWPSLIPRFTPTRQTPRNGFGTQSRTAGACHRRRDGGCHRLGRRRRRDLHLRLFHVPLRHSADPPSLRVIDINALRALAPLPRAPVPRSSRPQPRTPPPAGAAGTSVDTSTPSRPCSPTPTPPFPGHHASTPQPRWSRRHSCFRRGLHADGLTGGHVRRGPSAESPERCRDRSSPFRSTGQTGPG